MVIPDKFNLCQKCKGKPFPRWLRDKIDEWDDMNYPYESLRQSIVTCANKYLCPDCSRIYIKTFDDKNAFNKRTAGELEVFPYHQLVDILCGGSIEKKETEAKDNGNQET